MQEKVNDAGERRRKTPEQALAALMRLASRSERSSGDALRLMRQWGVEPAGQQAVLKKLVEQRFIDDARFAAAYVREKTNLDGWGVHKIRAALAARGVERGIVDRELAALDRDSARGRLDTMLERKLGKTAAASAWELRGKMVRYGLSLGYDYDDVVAAVERLVKS